MRWWRETVFYQIYLPSFQDGNGDGVGDFYGLIERLDYLQALGIGGIWITPFYPSPLVDNGYDISDYLNVAPRFGTLEVFAQLIAEAHQRNIRVIIDVVLNHVSTEHPWFKDAHNNPASQYRDYFIFTREPNNWQSFFGGSAWEPEAEGEYYYYHKFAVQQADLNWANPAVVDEAKAVLDFWLEMGVDGFRLDVINFLSCDASRTDNPMLDNGEQQHLNDINQPAIEDCLADLLAHVRAKGDCFIVGEVGSDKLDELVRYQSAALCDVVFNFNLASQPTFEPQQIFRQLEQMNSTHSGVPTLFFSSHDMPRMISRFGDGVGDIARARAVAALQLMASGVPFIYYGEEVGMQDYVATCPDDIYDIQGKMHYQQKLTTCGDPDEAFRFALTKSRDNSRSPMQWSCAPLAGFSSQVPWMPINENYREINAETAQQHSHSLWHDYQKMMALRAQYPVFQYGEYDGLALVQDTLIFSRCYRRQRATVLINFGRAYPLAAPLPGKVLFDTRKDSEMTNNDIVIYIEDNDD
ncbi:trehalose-6-phosphate hydrolase [Yersinia pekkanenii]|uniref:Trehalose-6-phosphate hydrolase n=2 Tax=Yersinia pekkanenii TaxID=1288385 RepID=A0A0T9NM38_9GAMM|nr:trehalose-6-phosphate hydrolase [Yersinia pekkanenii]CRY66055.1 trehalose-6-phosphate hydrolase [Yersinia pekkanenii]